MSAVRTGRYRHYKGKEYTVIGVAVLFGFEIRLAESQRAGRFRRGADDP